ncbi:MULTISPECIES: Fur family transcriptional regulator [Cupriavidus]
MNQRSLALQRLAGVRLRATRTRVLVLEALAAPDCAQADAETLLARLLLTGQRISLASIYRATRELEQHSLLVRHWTRGSRALYRLRAGPRPDAVLLVTDSAGGFARSVRDPAMYEQLLHWLGVQGLRGQPGTIRIQVEGMQGDAERLPLAPPRGGGRPAAEQATAPALPHDIFGRVPRRA